MNLPDFLEKTNYYLSRIYKPVSKATYKLRQRIRLCWYSANSRLIIIPKRKTSNNPSSDKQYTSLPLPANFLVSLPDNVRKIGIHGHAGAGKDTLLRGIMMGIEENEEYIARHIKFADSIYRVCRNFFSDSPRTVYDQELKYKVDPVLQISRRRFLQLFGNNFAKKHMGSDIWARIYKNKTNQRLIENNKCFICTSDVRFSCEVQAVKQGEAIDLGEDIGIVIEVIRPDLEWDSCFLHRSELPISVEDVALTIVNNGTEDDLIQTGKNLGRLFVKTAPSTKLSREAYTRKIGKVELN